MSMSMKKKTINCPWQDQNVVLDIIEINQKVRRDSDVYANLAYQDAIRKGYLINIQVDEIVRESGYDLDNETKEIEDLRSQIKTKEVTLLRGVSGNERLNKSQGRSLALEIRKLRNKIEDIVGNRSDLYSKTAEKYSDDERFLYLIHACSLDSRTGRPFFKTFDEFKESLESEVVKQCTKALLELVSNQSNIADTNLTEVKWLIKYNYMDTKGRLLDKEGRLVDEDFRLINEDGRYINEKGEFVDYLGNMVDVNGNLLVEADPMAYKE